MINIDYIGLDLFLVGEISALIHNKVASLLKVDESEVIISSYDSFVYYKGHEQTSINLLIRVDLDSSFKEYEKDLAKLLLDSSENYSVHSTVYFNYIDPKTTYSRINNDYPRFLTAENEATEDDYDPNKEYSKDEIFTGNIFEEEDK